MSGSSLTPDASVALLRSAAEHAKTGAYEEARAQLEALLAIDPRHEVALGMLAAVYAELKQPDRSAEYFERVLEMNADNVLARFQLGLVLLNAQRPADALAIWQLGQYSDSEYLVNYHRGLALLQLDRAQEALDMFQQSRAFMPADHVLYPQLLTHLISLTQ